MNHQPSGESGPEFLILIIDFGQHANLAIHRVDFRTDEGDLPV